MAGLMQGRNGNDQLGATSLILCFVFLLIYMFTGLDFLWIVGIAALAYSIFRTLSRNVHKRQAENQAFLQLVSKPRKTISVAIKAIRNRKTTMYFKCESCKTVLSVPRGKGRIKVTCPKCHHQTIRKS